MTYGDNVLTLANEQQFVYALAANINATLYVVEHRYFSGSKPDGRNEFKKYSEIQDMDPNKVVIDLQEVIKQVRKETQGKIIVSGEDYAGELAILMRKDKTITG